MIRHPISPSLVFVLSVVATCPTRLVAQGVIEAMSITPEDPVTEVGRPLQLTLTAVCDDLTTYEGGFSGRGTQERGKHGLKMRSARGECQCGAIPCVILQTRLDLRFLRQRFTTSYLPIRD